MSKSIEDIKNYLADFRSNFEARPLMYGGTLTGIQSVWFTINEFENFINEHSDKLSREAYRTVASKYKCGSWALCAKVEEEFKDKDDKEASDELIKRLQEVRQLEQELRNEKK